MTDFQHFKGSQIALMASVAIASLALIIGAFSSTFLSLHTVWTQNNETYSHGYVLVLFVAYALFTERRWLVYSPSYWSMPAAIAIGLVWIAAEAVQVQLVQQMLVPFMLAALLIAFVGIRNSLKAWVPLLGLYLAIPVMDIFLGPLQDLTTWAVSRGVRIVGITAYIEQYDIHIPYGTLRIADGCAGLNYMLAGLSVGLFYSYLNLVRMRDAALAIGLIIFIALVGNWIRVFALVLIGYYSKMESELVAEHGFFGWVIFAVLLIGYFFFMERYVAKQINNAEVQAVEPAQNINKGLALLVLSALLMLALPALTKQATQQNDGVELAIKLPNDLQSFTPTEQSSIALYSPRFVGHDELRVWQDVKNNYKLSVFTYLTQEQGKELIYFANHPANDISDVEALELENGQVLTGLTNNGRTRVFWFYLIGQETATSAMNTKLLQLKQAFSPQPAAAVVLFEDCYADCVHPSSSEWLTPAELEAILDIRF